jgi:hypothetical protein
MATLTLFEFVHFGNREAIAASSRGRKPTETRHKSGLSREAAAAHSARPIAAAASRLLVFFYFIFCGLTPAATYCRHYVADEAQLQNFRFGLR